MEINWLVIKKEIKLETQKIFRVDPLLNLDEIIDLFINVLHFPVETRDGKINGLSERVPNALHRIFNDNLPRIDINTYFGDAVKIEPYLRKILFLINPALYQKIHNDKDGLSSILSSLDLKTSTYNSHYWSTYNLRNDESHQCENWSNSEIWEKLRSVLVMYIFATYKHQKNLKIAINPLDVSGYLNKEIQRIKLLKNRYIHLEGKEELFEVDLFATEILDPTQFDKHNELLEPRIGKIDDLRKSLKERRLILLGDVGMGKSTTLLYLHLQDAEAAIANNNNNIPIYIELKNLTEKDTIKNKIKSKLEFDDDIMESLFINGKLNIFLDGLNEIEQKIKNSIYIQIRNLLDDYPNNFIIITSRPNSYNRDFDNQLLSSKIPVFKLQKMGDSQILEFLTKNGKNVKEFIVKEITENPRLKNIVQKPLMLTMLIAVVIKEGKIPNEKGKIIRLFMYSLYEREQKQSIDFDKDMFHILLCFLAFQTRELTGSNSGLDRDEYILPLLETRKSQLGLTINLLDFLLKAIDINILVKDDNQFSFSHELYQEYYAAEYLHLIIKK
jgi:hypothetical protein